MASSNQTANSTPTANSGDDKRLFYSAGFEKYRLDWKVWAIWMLVFFLYSAIPGRDAHFDVAHYHLHNGWSVLNGRLHQDLAPAELHSFLNPVHSALVWFLIEHLPGPLVTSLLGLVQGLIFPAIYALTARLAFRLEVDTSRLMIGVIAFTGFVAQPMWVMLSGLRNDHWGALAFIVALSLLIGRQQRPPNLKALGVAAGLMGLMLGLKLTNLVYVPAFAVAAIVAVPGIRMRLKAIAVCTVAGLAGTLATGGWWAYVMWEKFGNPIYPNMNSFFGAPLGPDSAFRDERYLPETFLEVVLRPFQFSFNGKLINEYDYSDFRFLLGYVCCFVIAGLLATKAARGELTERARPLLALVAGFTISFITWSLMFSIQRYAMGLWLIGPSLLAATVWYVYPGILKASSGRIGLIIAMAALMITTSFDTLRLAPWQSWTEPYVWTELPEDVDVSDAIILLSSYYPTGFTAPAFDQAAWLSHADTRPWSRPALENYRPLIQTAIDDSQNPIFGVLYVGQDSGSDALQRMADNYSLRARFDDCRRLKTAFDGTKTYWALCPMQRTP